jgi:hypothetical protein
LFIFKILYMENWKSVFSNLFFFFYNPRYLGQFIRTTTNHRAHWTPCKSNEQVRHHKDDIYMQRGSNPSAEKENKFFSLLAHDLKCPIFYFYSLVWKTSFFFFFNVIQPFHYMNAAFPFVKIRFFIPLSLHLQIFLYKQSLPCMI